MLFRWYTQRTFDREFPPWTENLVVVPGAQIFAFKPHASGVFPGNVDMKRTFPYRTNAHGLRDRDRSEKAPGTKRVLVMGDSYTWGYAVAEEEAYPQVAERLLEGARPSGHRSHQRWDSGLQQPAGAAASGAAHADLPAGRGLSRLRRE